MVKVSMDITTLELIFDNEIQLKYALDLDDVK